MSKIKRRILMLIIIATCQEVLAVSDAHQAYSYYTQLLKQEVIADYQKEYNVSNKEAYKAVAIGNLGARQIIKAKLEKYQINDKLLDVLRQYENVERLKKTTKKQNEIEALKDAKEKLKIMYEMSNPSYVDISPRNFVSKIIKRLVQQYYVTIYEAEQMVINNDPRAKKIFNEVSDEIRRKEYKAAKLRVQQYNFSNQ